MSVCLEALPNNEAVAIEFNLWTKPDCGGTEYENLNRSWFFFSIQGKIVVVIGFFSYQTCSCQLPVNINKMITNQFTHFPIISA